MEVYVLELVFNKENNHCDSLHEREALQNLGFLCKAGIQMC